MLRSISLPNSGRGRRIALKSSGEPAERSALAQIRRSRCPTTSQVKSRFALTRFKAMGAVVMVIAMSALPAARPDRLSALRGQNS